MLRDISPEELKSLREGAAPPLVLDVREPWELEVSRLDGTLDIPMSDIPQRLGEIDRTREIVVICRSGGRSRNVAQFLLRQGYPSVANLSGGILAWGERIDPTLTPY